MYELSEDEDIDVLESSDSSEEEKAGNEMHQATDNKTDKDSMTVRTKNSSASLSKDVRYDS